VENIGFEKTVSIYSIVSCHLFILLHQQNSCFFILSKKKTAVAFGYVPAPEEGTPSEGAFPSPLFPQISISISILLTSSLRDVGDFFSFLKRGLLCH
jgi:hypothetical protein